MNSMNQKTALKRISVLLTCLLLAFASFARNPIVFLHGYDSDGTIWSDMKTLLVSDAGYASNALRAYSYYKSYFGYSTSTPIEQVAIGVAKEIAELSQNTGRPVDIIGHSMGGLIVRAMLTYNLIDRKYIGKFITLATPHYGQNIESDIISWLFVGKQASQMKYGSLFLWDLADAWHFQGKKIDQTLCIAGTVDYHQENYRKSYWDGLVHSWSASLADDPCRYVYKCHSKYSFNVPGAIIYRCSEGKSDPVYRLVKNFLLNGMILSQSSIGYTPPATVTSQGGIFFQIVNTSGYSVSYSTSTSALVPTYVHIGQNQRIIADSLEHGAGDTESQPYGIEMVYGTLPVGNYRLLTKEADYIQSFLAQPVPVTGGRMTVCRLRSDGTVLKDTVTAKLETNGGTLPSPYADGKLTSLIGYPYGTLPTPVKPGHRFDGWYTTPDYANIVTSLTLASPLNTTLYAKLTPLTFTLTFYANGGAGTMEPQNFLYDVAQNITPCTFTRPEYAFVGWAKSPSDPAGFSNGERVSLLSNYSLYAVWEPVIPLETALPSDSLTFTTGGDSPWFGQESDPSDGNGFVRSGSIGSEQNSWLETTVRGPGTISFRWNVHSEGIPYDYLEFLVDGKQQARIGGTNTVWQQKSVTIRTGGDHALRWNYTKDEALSIQPDCGWVDQIVWTPAALAVTFDAWGGRTDATTFTRMYEEAIGELPDAKRTGYTFLGWFTKATGGNEVTAETPVTESLTCYAHWRINTYTVTFDTAGGSEVPPLLRDYNTEIGTLPRPEREGFRFRGWYTDPEGGTRIRTTIKVTDDMTIYAHWIDGGSSAYRLYSDPIYGQIPSVYKGGKYNGYAVDNNGNITGTFTLLVKKPKKGATTTAATVTFTALTTGKRTKFSGTINLQTGTGTGMLSGILVGTTAVGGVIDRIGEIEGGIDAGKAKRTDLLSALAKFNRRSYGIALETDSVNGTGSAFANGFSILSITISTKGKAKVMGVLADGTKVTISTQLTVGDDTCCIPILYSKKSRFGFTVWFDRQTLELLDLTALTTWRKVVKPVFEADWFPVAFGSRSHLANGLKTVTLDSDVLYHLVPAAITQTPSEVTLNVTGKTAWNAGKAAKVMYKSGTVSVNGSNISGLKLSFLPKTGLFKGSFTVYSVSKGKLIRNKFSVNGIVIDGTGYGSAVLRNKGVVSLLIE
ncbi:MAG: InlB B-repeat-containing protein [Kiritimatiellae bacterium]|nr:InlB B-repeat-containing protein [Kiritimatiellia bacterium]